MGTLCLSEEYKSPPPNTYISRRKLRWLPSCESKRPSPRRNREETPQTEEDRYRTSRNRCYLRLDPVRHTIVWSIGFNCPVGVKIPTVIKIGTFREQKPVVKCWVSINPRLKFIQIFRNRNVTHAGILTDIFLDIMRTGHSVISKLCVQSSQSFPPNQNGQNVYILGYTLNFHLFNMGHLEAILLLILKSSREIVEYFQAMTFIAPWLSFTKVLLLRHVDNAPLHRINAVVWNGFNE